MAGGGYKFDGETYKRGRDWRLGELHGVAHAEDGDYRCYSCGARWTPEDVYCWWPIEFKIVRHWALAVWGIDVGWDGIERPIVRRVVGIGPFRIMFGPRV